MGSSSSRNRARTGQDASSKKGQLDRDRYEIRYQVDAEGNRVLDEVVAKNATVHLEAMSDDLWSLIIEPEGGPQVMVQLFRKKKRVVAMAEVDE